MIFIGIFLICFTGILFMTISRKKNNFFSPIIFFNLWTIISTVPRIIQISNLYSTNQWLQYFIYTTLYMISVNLGIIAISKRVTLNKTIYSNLNQKKYGILLFIVGSLSRIILVVNSGGFIKVISSTGVRTQILAGLGYLNLLTILIVYGITLYYISYLTDLKRKNAKKADLVILIIMIFSGSFLLIVFGNRSPLLEMVIALLIALNFHSKTLKIKDFFKPQALLLAMFIVLFMFMMPLLRNRDNSNLFLDPAQWVRMAIENPTKGIFQEISTVDRDIFTFEYFERETKWYGKVYLNIFYQPIPSTIFPNKPPMDDGMYLYNIMRGQSVSPNTPTNQLEYQTSIPFSTAGIAYANFGLIGIILGGFLIGLIHSISYRRLIKSNFSAGFIIIYQIVLFRLELSTLHILSSLIPIVLIYILDTRIVKYSMFKKRVS